MSQSGWLRNPGITAKYSIPTRGRVARAAFSEAFAQNREKQAQWVAFVRRHQYADVPATLDEAIQVIAAFLRPVVQALTEGRTLGCRWLPGGPWSEDL